MITKIKLFLIKATPYIFYAGLLSMFVVLHFTRTDNPTLEVDNINQAWIPLAAAGVSLLGGLFQGASQRRAANRLEQSNVRPVYQPNAALLQNQAIATQMSRVGLPSQVYNNNLNQIQQGFATGLRQLGSRGNVPFNVNSFIRSNNQAIGNLNALDAQYRQQGQQQLMNANQALAQDQRYAFQVNQQQPYMMNAQNVANMRNAGTQNIFGALGGLAQGALIYGQGRQQAASAAGTPLGFNNLWG